MRQIKFIANGVRWFDKVNGNTYHSVRITNTKTGETLVAPMQYGYDDAYRQTALQTMFEAGWIPKKYGKEHSNGSTNLYSFERENGYPIEWQVRDSLKRDCIANGTL